MKYKYSVLILILVLNILTGHSQSKQPNGMERNTEKPLALHVKEIATKYNQTVLGKNSFVFEPSMDMKEIQTLIDSIYVGLTFPLYEFSGQRCAFLFKPGMYHLDIKVGYYTHVIGLGRSPEDVVIVGAVRSNATQGHVLCNFWRSAENLTIVPAANSTNTWGVSQAAPLRRVYVKGNLQLFEGASSGGFMADCKIDGTVFSGSQQQWFSRNSDFEKWDGGVWNMVYLGVRNAPLENWPEKPITTISETPEVREKPYWAYVKGVFSLIVPALKRNSTGVDWKDRNNEETVISIKDFYIVKTDIDNAASINKALKKGKHILFPPGVYSLSESLEVICPGTIVMGMGMATLVPVNGNKVLTVADVDGVTVAGLVVDASVIPSETLMQIGEADAKLNHEMNPTFLYDVFFRIGGAREGSASRCLVVNSNNVYIDHAWFWRADHGNGIGWEKNKCANGLVVNGGNVTVYGLFNEHFQEYQTVWNGDKGRVYFYQCELPYDPPTNDSWRHEDTLGYASYKVGNQVKDHHAWGIGVYGFFETPLIVDQMIETPAVVEKKFYHKVVVMLGWNKKTDTVFKSIINGKGGSIHTTNRKQTME